MKNRINNISELLKALSGYLQKSDHVLAADFDNLLLGYFKLLFFLELYRKTKLVEMMKKIMENKLRTHLHVLYNFVPPIDMMLLDLL